MTEVLDEVQQQLRMIARVQQERARLTATAETRNRRVAVTVNADGLVIETKFGAEIGDLSYPEIARAVTEAAQQAAAEVARLGGELMAPLQDRRARLPKLSDLIEGMPDLSAEMPTPPSVPTTPPEGAQRPTAAARDEDEPVEMRFTDVEEVDHGRGKAHGVTDSSW
ncbi:YbaB/EbfC family nucleoid-associated protein [Nocardia puris]|nr:YbaB/EbfC family nucleoid-associated protein [Nocardia puris]MBF6366819.1 YbaB/EbfC family nucleoid-associated protein [Nocardia puris]MBF6460793.1 YbaB/EbfC family nucleoid-associated protein [Nocardia puris]